MCYKTRFTISYHYSILLNWTNAQEKINIKSIEEIAFYRTNVWIILFYFYFESVLYKETNCTIKSECISTKLSTKEIKTNIKIAWHAAP